jgi:hypothetical protein
VDQRHMGSGGRGRIGGDHQFLAPGRAPAILPQLAPQGLRGLGARRALAPDQGDIAGEAIDIP